MTARGSEPVVSVVVPVFQGASTIAATLHSVLGQTFPDLEVIVVNDGSTDQTGDIVDAVAARDPRVRPVHLDRNGGRSAARNHGMTVARGRWITNLDADDLWAATRLDRLVAATSSFPDSRLITDDTMQFWVRPDGSVRLGHRFPTRVTWRLHEAPHRPRLREWYLDMECPMRPLIRRDLLVETGATYPEDISAGEDLAFQLELVFSPAGSKPVRVGWPGYYYREGESLRAANAAQNRLRVNRRVFDRTGNEQFRRWSRLADPGRLFMHQRVDRQFVASGRAGPGDEVAPEAVRVSAVRGYGRLVAGRGLKELSAVADRRLRPSIIADIERQLRDPSLAGGRPVPGL